MSGDLVLGSRLGQPRVCIISGQRGRVGGKKPLNLRSFLRRNVCREGVAYQKAGGSGISGIVPEALRVPEPAWPLGRAFRKTDAISVLARSFGGPLF